MSKQNGNRGVSVKGLAALGTLLNRADLPNTPTAPKRERRTLDQIYDRTHEKIVASIEGNERCSAASILGHYLKAALREAYNSGHADALDQNSAVEKLLEQQYDARTKMTLPAAVAWIMEQRGIPEMTLDLSMLATVFDRQHIDFSIATADESTELIAYRITPIDEA